MEAASNDLILDWEDYIEEDSGEFLVLEEGDYNFTVTEMERSRSKGTGKIPACPMAALTLTVDAGNGKTTSCHTNILLYKTLEWKISSFFRCIGSKKEGERVKMDWTKVIGATGRAHFKPRNYTNQNGEERQTNEVDYFIDFDEKLTPKPDPMAGFTAVPEGKEEELPFN